MPIDPGRLQRLDGFLGDVTPTLALQLARAVELDRMRGGALPHDEILAALRPRLREVSDRLERAPTPQRLVCTAFEDILVDDRLRKQQGRILRASIVPTWTWLTRTLAPQAAETALDAIRDRLLNGGPDFAEDALAAFRKMAADAILQAIPTADMSDPRAADAVQALGPDIAADAYDMARMMAAAPEIGVLQRDLPRSIPALTDEGIAKVRATFDRVAQAHPDSASYVVFLILARLQKPWEALRLAGALSRKADDVMLSRTDLGLIGETLLSDLEICVARLVAMRTQEIDADVALAQVATFAHVSTGIVRELGIRRDGQWGRRLMQMRGDIADQMERLLARAGKDITATLPTVRRGGFGLRGARRAPDLTRSFDAQKAERALALARVIAGSRPHAIAGAFAGMLARVDEAATGHLRRYTHDLADEVHALGHEAPPGAGRFAEHAIALTAVLDSQEEADTLRRRVKAALAIVPAPDMVA